MQIDADELRRRLEETGEKKVRERLAINVYGSEERGIVEQWLLSKNKEKSAKNKEEQLNIAKGAVRAAWVSAVAAIVSAMAAIAAWIS